MDFSVLISNLFLIFADSRARLVAGSFQGYTGHIDGKPNEVRFNHPRGLTMDDKGNIYVADSLNHAIRKIGDAGIKSLQ
jgi:sugar lactone lactonase YvrE